MWTFYHQTALKTKTRSGLRVSVRVSVRVWRVRILNLSVCVSVVVKSIQHISCCPRQQTHIYHHVWLLYHTRHVSFNNPWHGEDTSLEMFHGNIVTHLIKENNLKLVHVWIHPRQKNNIKKITFKWNVWKCRWSLIIRYVSPSVGPDLYCNMETTDDSVHSLPDDLTLNLPRLKKK